MKSSLVVTLIAGGLVATVFANSIEWGTVTGDRVNVRARPMGTAEICCQLSQGSLVEILERRRIQTTGTNTEEWVRIVLPDKALVWIQSSYVDPERKILTKVNGRAGPSLMWPVLCVYSPGDVVQSRTNELDWIGVTPSPSASAWISGKYIRRENVEVPTAKIAETP